MSAPYIFDAKGHKWSVRQTAATGERAYWAQSVDTGASVLPGIVGFYAASEDAIRIRLGAAPIFDPRRPIIHERHIMRALREEGWIGHASQLRALAFHGEDLRQRYENEASHAWAGNSGTYKAGTERLELHIAKLAHEAGLALYIQGDCRGVAVYVRDGSKEIDDNRYSTQAQALHYGRG